MMDVHDLPKFESILAEFEVGRFLLNHGKTVRFLCDNYMGPNKKSPDILAIDANTNVEEAYVEVKLITEDNVIHGTFLSKLRNFLNISKINVCVDVKLSGKFLIPAVTRQERQEKEQLASEVIREFVQKFTQLGANMLPCEIKTAEAIFTVRCSTIKRSFVGAITTLPAQIPEENLGERIRLVVCEAASKRTTWSGGDLLKPYFVAVCSKQWAIDSDLAEKVLIGTTCTVMQGSPMPTVDMPIEVENARKKGWEAFLREKYIIPNNRTYLVWNKRGIYFTEPVTKNINGVIFIFLHSGRYHFIPNPFACDQINNPGLVNYV